MLTLSLIPPGIFAFGHAYSQRVGSVEKSANSSLRIRRYGGDEAVKALRAIWMYTAQRLPDCFVTLRVPCNDKSRGFSPNPVI